MNAARSMFQFLLLAIPMVLFAPGSNASASACDLTVSLSPAELRAQVGPTHAAAVVFSGSFHVTKSPGESGAISFSALVSAGWPVTVSPANVSVGGEPQMNGSFEVHVIVPPAEPAGHVANVVVTATGQVGASLCPPESAQVVVSPLPYSCSSISINPARSFLEVEGPSDQAVVDLSFRCLANRMENITAQLRVMGPSGMTHNASDIVMLSDFENGSIRGNLSIRFTMTHVPPGDHKIELYAFRSSAGPDPRDVSTVVFVRVAERVPIALLLLIGAGGFTATMAAAVWLWKHPRKEA
jgi:hypothetical protein